MEERETFRVQKVITCARGGVLFTKLRGGKERFFGGGKGKDCLYKKRRGQGGGLTLRKVAKKKEKGNQQIGGRRPFLNNGRGGSKKIPCRMEKDVD